MKNRFKKFISILMIVTVLGSIVGCNEKSDSESTANKSDSKALKGEITFTVKPVVINDDDVDLYFSVKDTGAGIRKEDIDRFKDSFVRLENVKNSNISGLGLGLTITTRLLALMGSKLDIDSVYGEGSDFHFDIWQKIVDKTPVGDVKPKVEKAPKKKKITFTAPEIRVLAVDDNKMNLRVLSGILKTTKMQIETCESGAKCLELCKDTRYDIVFMDHMMPEMDGIETFKKIRENTELKSNDSIIFVLTANTVTGAEEMYKEVGFDYYLKKPIDVSELNEVLQMYIPKDRILPVEAS